MLWFCGETTMYSNATVHVRAHLISPALRWLTLVAPAGVPRCCCGNQLQPNVWFQTHTFDVPWPLRRGVSNPLSHPPDSQPHTPQFLAVGEHVVVHHLVRPRPLSNPPHAGVNLNPRQLKLPGPHRHHLLPQLLRPAPGEPVHLSLHARGGLCLEQWFSTTVSPHRWANALHVSMWRVI